MTIGLQEITENWLSDEKKILGIRMIIFKMIPNGLETFVSANGKIQSIKAWGVNYKEVLGPDERKTKNYFTVWLTEAGTLSELKAIPVGW